MTLLRDTWLIFQRQLTQTVRSPVLLVMGLIQPLYYMFLFAPLLRDALGMADAGEAYQFFVPGVLVMITIFVSAYAGFALLGELRAGVIERSRVTPVSRLALLLGRSLRDIAGLVVQCGIVLLLAIPFGLSAHPGGVLIAFALIALIGLALSSVSYGIALKLRSDQALGSIVSTVGLPIILLSGILLPMTFGPVWLRAISEVNPASWAVDAARAAFAGDFGDPGIWQATLLLAVLAVAAVTWAARAFASGVR